MKWERQNMIAKLQNFLKIKCFYLKIYNFAKNTLMNKFLILLFFYATVAISAVSQTKLSSNEIDNHLSEQMMSLIKYIEKGEMGLAIRKVNYLEEMYSSGSIPLIFCNGIAYKNVKFTPNGEVLEGLRYSKIELSKRIIGAFQPDNSTEEVVFYRIPKDGKNYIKIETPWSGILVSKDEIPSIKRNLEASAEKLRLNYNDYLSEFKKSAYKERIRIPELKNTGYFSLDYLENKEEITYRIDCRRNTFELFISIEGTYHASVFPQMTRNDVNNFIKYLSQI